MNKQIKDIREFQEKIAEVKEGSIFNHYSKVDVDAHINTRTKLLQEEVDELKNALNEEDQVEILDAGVDILYILLGTMHDAGVLDKFQNAWDLVHANNMTKIGPDGKVLKNENGKVIKPEGYKPVNLKQLF